MEPTSKPTTADGIEEWDLTATNLFRVRQRRYEVAVIPTGAIEPHNRHLPYGQDFRHTSWVARRCCRLAWAKTPSVICLPAIPYGVDCNLMDFPLTIHVSQATLDGLLREIIVSLRRHG
ncbi:MAG: creatininase family protein, partial [Sedimentisphaerales bacterium]|nr:creatininase family protein [Sedimentisphaerales bacterium]